MREEGKKQRRGLMERSSHPYRAKNLERGQVLETDSYAKKERTGRKEFITIGEKKVLEDKTSDWGKK